MTRPTVFVVNDAPVETANGSLTYKLARHRLRAADLADVLNKDAPGSARVISVLPPEHPEATPERVAHWAEKGVTVRPIGDPALAEDFKRAHVVMTQTEDARYQDVARTAKASGAHLTVDYNDNYFAGPPAGSVHEKPGAREHFIAMARIADTRLSNTQAMQRALDDAAFEHGFARPDVHIPDPVGPKLREPRATVGTGFHIVFEGHHEHMKAVADAAIQILKKTEPFYVHIDIVSNMAKLPSEAEAMVERETRRIMDATNLDRASIGFIPWTPDAQRQAFARADLVIVPRGDNPDPWNAVKSPVAVTEALRHGRMVVASDTISSISNLQHRGVPFITTPNDKFGKTVAKTMRQMMRNPRSIATDIGRAQQWLEAKRSTAEIAHAFADLSNPPELSKTARHTIGDPRPAFQRRIAMP